MKLLSEDRLNSQDYPNPRLILDAPADLPAEDLAYLLADLISAISEECWCAGWMTGIEDDAWKWSGRTGDDEIDYGMGVVSAESVAALRLARERLAGAWVAWEYSLQGAGVHLLTAEEWADTKE